jgi:hypothetical protein
LKKLNKYSKITQVDLDLFIEIKGTFENPDEEWLRTYPVE